MENNNLTLDTSLSQKEWSKLVEYLNLTAHLCKQSVFRKLASVYSEALGEHISPHQAVYFFYAQMATCGLFMPFELGSGWRVSFLLVIVYALRRIYAKNR